MQACDFPVCFRDRLLGSFAIAFYEMSSAPECAELDSGTWATLQFLAGRWGKNADAWPSQAAIARYIRCSDRAVRRYLAILRLRGLILEVRRWRDAEGHERVAYAPGSAFLAAFGRYVHGRKPVDTMARGPRTPWPGNGDHSSMDLVPFGETAAQPEEEEPVFNLCEQPERVSARELDELLSDEPPPPPPVDETAADNGNAGELVEVRVYDLAPPVEVPDELPAVEVETIARGTLAAWWQRRHPNARRRLWDTSDLAPVVARVHDLSGDAAARTQAMRDALDGAWSRSTGAPSLRFVFEGSPCPARAASLFLDLVELGARARRARQRAELRPVTAQLRAPTAAEVAANLAGAQALLAMVAS
jgi:hypothetical protein